LSTSDAVSALVSTAGAAVRAGVGVVGSNPAARSASSASVAFGAPTRKVVITLFRDGHPPISTARARTFSASTSGASG
jgi:hypothetical protein